MLSEMSYPTDSSAAQPAIRPVKTAPRPKQRPPQSSPFDADDLSRRLYGVLAEQKTHAERRRRARAEAERLAKQHKKPSETRHRRSQVEPANVHPRERHIQATVQPIHAAEQQPRTDEKHGAERSQRRSSKDRLVRTISKTSTGSSGRDAEDGSSASYRHVPQVAASQFARTTAFDTAADKGLAHKLSKTAMKFHMAGPNGSRDMTAINAATAPSEQTRALRRAQSQRGKQYDRNQFQHPPIFEVAAEADEKQARQSQRHTLETHFRSKASEYKEDKGARRVSTGAFLGAADMTSGSIDVAEGIIPVERHESYGEYDTNANLGEPRVDWTQSDEAAIPYRPMSPQLRKPDSRWSLRGKLGSFSKHDRDEKMRYPPLQGVVEGVTCENALKSPKSGFFARFKR